jgi:hypothetical protein
VGRAKVTGFPAPWLHGTIVPAAGSAELKGGVGSRKHLLCAKELMKTLNAVKTHEPNAIFSAHRFVRRVEVKDQFV